MREGIELKQQSISTLVQDLLAVLTPEERELFERRRDRKMRGHNRIER